MTDEPAPPLHTRAARVGLVGLVGGPLLAALVYFLVPLCAAEQASDCVFQPGRAVAAIGTLMAIWWMTEALPLPATSLAPIALFPFMGVSTIADATAPYAHKYIFLFMGGFLLALAMERWRLHKRVALVVLSVFGVKPSGVILGFMCATALLSMWVSNTATAVMMVPIAISVVSLMREDARVSERDFTKFAAALLLSVAYAANIGGVATIIGTPPNVFLAGYIEQTHGEQVSFLKWMAFGVPFAIVFLLVAWLLLTRAIFRFDFKEFSGGRALIRRELAGLGPPSRGEWSVFVVFTLTAAAWVARGALREWDGFVEANPWFLRIDDAGVAITAALLLFLIPVDTKKGVFVLDWPTARQLPWGVLLLFGGGLSLAAGVQESGLDAWIGARLSYAGALPGWALIALVTLVVIFLTEITSNTATAATFVPILGGVALSLGTAPGPLLVSATIAASCAFMMPVATPPNAIVFGSGRVTIAQMMKAGVWLNILGVVIISTFAYTLIAWTLGGLAG